MEDVLSQYCSAEKNVDKSCSKNDFNEEKSRFCSKKADKDDEEEDGLDRSNMESCSVQRSALSKLSSDFEEMNVEEEKKKVVNHRPLNCFEFRIEYSSSRRSNELSDYQSTPSVVIHFSTPLEW
jgi:hypothetical protein